MIPVYRPWLTDLEKSYVTEAVESTWISSTGKFIDRAEELFAEFVGVKHCVLASSGTTALHLCLKAAGLKEGIIISPNLTFAATAFAASYLGRKIEFVDSNPSTWNIDVDQVEKLCKTTKVAAVVPVHLYGNPADMKRLKQLQDEYGFALIEDACESIDAKIDSQKTGTWSDLACFSFYGNKTLSCGEGGAVTTNSQELADRARLFRGQAMDPNKRYWHVDIGHNYRMTNMQAAVLTAQLERADEILAEKRRVAARYLSNLDGLVKFQKVFSGHEHSYWLISVETEYKFEALAPKMRQRGVDVRPIFYPMTDMPPYYQPGVSPIAHHLSTHGISLPSYPTLTNSEIDKVCLALQESIHEAAKLK